MKICICGGGALGHVVAAWTAAKFDESRVSVLTNKPQLWSNSVKVYLPDGDSFVGELESVSSNPAEVISDADVVLFCYPGFAIREELVRIKPFLSKDCFVGAVFSSTGFFFEALKVLPASQPLWGFQRVPFIARVREYGHSVNLLGFKSSLNVAVEHVCDERKNEFVTCLSRWFDCPVKLLKNYYEASLTNSNPLLHTSRLYSLFSREENEVYPRMILFYEEWTEDSAQLLIDMDKELFRLISVLPVTPGFLLPVLDYYESRDAASLASKLRSISAFKGIGSPMIQTECGWVPDYTSRYFTEDFPYGLRYIVELARDKGVKVPIMEKVLSWGMSKIKNH